MHDRDNGGFAGGPSERNVARTRTGSRVTRTQVTEEGITPEGVMQKRQVDERPCMACGHLDAEAGGECLCGRVWCKKCVEKMGFCFVCGRLCCPSCGVRTVLDRNKWYHKACFREALKRKIFG